MPKTSLPIRHYLRIAFRRKWAFIIPALLGVLMIPPLVMRTQSRYRASATVRRQDLAIVNAVPSGLMTRDTPRISLEALRVEILTWQNLQRVILQTRLDPELMDPDQNPEKWQRKFRELASIISIQRVAQSPGVDIVEISVTHTDPEMARRIVDGVANNYMEEAQRSGREEIEKLVDFLGERTKQNQAALRQVELELDKYHEKHFASLDNVKLRIRNRILELQTDESARSLQLAAIREQLAEALEQLQDIPQTTKETSTEANPALAEMQRQINERRTHLVALELRYTDEHPRIARARTELIELEARLEDKPDRVVQVEKEVPNPVYQQVAGEVMSLKQQIRSHEAAILQIGTRIVANEDSLRQVATEEKRYRDYQREQEQYSSLYQAYRSSLVAAQTRMDVDRDAKYGTRVDMISPPQTPAFPETRTPRKVAAASAMAGIAVGFVMVFLLEVLDRSIRDVEDATAYFKFPVLGSIQTILTPRDREIRRWKRFMLFSLFLIVAAGGVAAAVWMERVNPGTTEDLLAKARVFVDRLAR